jgi:hypothetical protein|tara:strand:- start:1899 stop:2096 length:198 start_codon:yes stop_codon:yes gene_type:complete
MIDTAAGAGVGVGVIAPTSSHESKIAFSDGVGSALEITLETESEIDFDAGAVLNESSTSLWPRDS